MKELPGAAIKARRVAHVKITEVEGLTFETTDYKNMDAGIHVMVADGQLYLDVYGDYGALSNRLMDWDVIKQSIYAQIRPK